MASAFAHAVAAAAVGSGLGLSTQQWRLLILGMVWASIPDLDSIGFWWGIPYEHALGHRGLTHSIPFAVVASWGLVKLGWSGRSLMERRRLWLFFFLTMASHGVLDALTDGGLGVAFFAPFDNERYFFPFRPLVVPPLEPNKFFSLRAIPILMSEFLWVWIPSLAVILAAWWRRKARQVGRMPAR